MATPGAPSPGSIDDGTFASGVVHIADRPEEHVIWQREVEPHLWMARSNVQRICEHGFTEIFNNAVDHSGGSTVVFIAKCEAGIIRFTIRDDGIGIFEKIRAFLGLEDYRQAMLELSKGKLTTDTARHSGQGIFFTSRMFDRFHLLSNGVGFCHNVGEHDWLIENEALEGPGTLVIMEIAVDAERTTREVFDQFSDIDSDDYSFSKTHVPLKLAKYGTGGLVSRSEAKRVLSRFEGFREVLLDFGGIESIGQAFADEIFRVFRSSHPDVAIVAIRANEPVQRMIDRARGDTVIQPVAPLTIPTTREMLGAYRAGIHNEAIIPVLPGRRLERGDQVVFVEATFDQMGIPSFVAGGESMSVTLTKAEDTGSLYGPMRLFAIGWIPAADAGRGDAKGR